MATVHFHPAMNLLGKPWSIENATDEQVAALVAIDAAPFSLIGANA